MISVHQKLRDEMHMGRNVGIQSVDDSPNVLVINQKIQLPIYQNQVLDLRTLINQMDFNV